MNAKERRTHKMNASPTTLKRTSFISPRRICIIASHTFTQLVRMKVFYFVIIFALLAWAIPRFMTGIISAGDSASEQELRLIKSTSFFAMNLFGFVMAIASTALLIPKDIEDRTLYTILCKPVPRLDYLIGKLVGVITLIFLCLLFMNILLSWSLYDKCAELVKLEREIMQGRYAPDYIESQITNLKQHGLTMSVHYAAIAIFLKAAIITAIALLISTFSSSTIFTIILSIMVVLIGMIQADAREYLLKFADANNYSKAAKSALGLAVIAPDFQLMSIDDGAINGKTISALVLGKISLVAFLYMALYTVLAWFAFRKKEF